MTNQSKLKQCFERVHNALKKNPSLGHEIHHSVTQIQGLSCEIREKDWHFKVDMPKAAGGMGEASPPGALGRAALGSCLAIGYQLTAARLDVPVSKLTVEIFAEADGGGLFATVDTPPGYSTVRYCVSVESSASEESILAMLDEADRHSPWLDVFTRAISCTRQVRIVGSD